jgi:uncharacterized protein (TIGR03435 family)
MSAISIRGLRIMLVGATLVALMRMVSAQTSVDGPTFDVASVKPNRSGSPARAMGPEPGGFGAINIGLRDLVAFAYGVTYDSADTRVIGGPDWIASQRFDISAKTAAPRDRIAAMVQSLLQERFKLRAHIETREVSIYALVLAREGALGPQLHRSEIDCAARREAARGGTLPPPAPPGARPMCTGRNIPGTIVGGALTLDSLASALTRFAGRPVTNETGLTGAFDYDLTWTPEAIPEPAAGAPPLIIDPNGPSLMTAVQEQLGLKLEPERVPADVVVIDSAELPSPD